MTAPVDPTLTLSPGRRADGRSRLLVFDGDSTTEIALPRDGAVVIGRAPDVEVRLVDAAASRRHALLSIAAGEVRVSDLGSHNGTRVNGEPLAGARTLMSGDVVNIGESSMVLHCAPRHAGASPSVLDDLRARLEDELARAAPGGAPVAVVAISVGAEVTDRARLLATTAALLGAGDFSAWEGEGQLVALLPRRDAAGAKSLAQRLLAAVAGLAPGARAGYATCPADGCDAGALLAAARVAAATGKPGAVTAAAGGVQVIELPERTILVADPAMQRLYLLVRRLAARELPVLVCGETGVGKENAALALHAWSPRAGQSFVALNCAAIHEQLVESQLFGHARGAFSGAVTAQPGLLESASGGTVFLDEIGELSLAVQAKLLRVLETKTVTRLGEVKERAADVRIVAATHRDLEADIGAGRFRQDLFFRLAAATLILPPLRERPLEMPVLARAFLDAACHNAGRRPMTISRAALRLLAQHPWPGNIRELKNLMEYASAAVVEDTLEPEHLPARILGVTSAGDEAPLDEATPDGSPDAVDGARSFRPVSDELRELERTRMEEALEACGGVQARAAQLIGMPLRTFMTRMKQHGLTANRRR